MNIKKTYLSIIAITVFLVPFAYAQGATTVCADIQTSLNLGSGNSKKAEVVKLQNFLRTQGYLNSESTGYFGQATFNAVKAFQKAKGLQVVGNVGPQTRAEIKKVSCVVATNSPVQNTAPTVKPAQQVAQAVSVIAKADLPYSADNFSEWQKAWGVVTKSETGSLLLKSSGSETSVQATLPKSKDWTDYKYTANVTVTNGNIMLVARKVDDKNLLICAFSGNNVQIQQRLNDKVTVLKSVTISEMSSSVYFQKNLSVSMRVKGDTVGCSLVGSEDNVSYTGIDKKLSKGGIGIQSWYAAPGSAKIELKNVSVVSE
jgi:peptidoglycan hydrolase-like protein with peptidoglycan-binding domain